MIRHEYKIRHRTSLDIKIYYVRDHFLSFLVQEMLNAAKVPYLFIINSRICNLKTVQKEVRELFYRPISPRLESSIFRLLVTDSLVI